MQITWERKKRRKILMGFRKDFFSFSSDCKNVKRAAFVDNDITMVDLSRFYENDLCIFLLYIYRDRYIIITKLLRRVFLNFLSFCIDSTQIMFGTEKFRNS